MASNPGTFDVVGGADQNTLTSAAATFYAAFPSLFTQSFTLPAPPGGSATVAFQSAPTISIPLSDQITAEAKAVAAKFPAEHYEDIMAMLTGSTFTIACSQLAVNITPASGAPIPITGALSALALIEVTTNAQGQPVMAFQATTATFDSGNPTVDALVNELVMPLLLPYLNNNILSPIQIPQLTFENVTLVPPVVTDETAGGDEWMLAYTGMQPVTLPSEGTAWPAGVAFIGVDAAVLNAVAANVLPSYNGSGGTDEPNLSWDYSLNFPNPSFQLQPGNGNAVTATLSVNGSADITWHTPNGFPNISFGASISGSATLMGQITAVSDGANQDIELTVLNVGDFDLSLDGLPSWIPINFILDGIAAAASAFLQNYSFKVYTLDPIALSFAGVSGTLSLQNLNLDQIAGPAGALLTIEAQPTFAATSQEAAPSWRRQPKEELEPAE